MPIVRLSRDKRGLDTIYLIDTAAEGGRRTGGARVLYFWTAPPGLRVGRSALDESAQRALQRAHPEVSFDWPALRKAVDAALAQAAALSTDARRDTWRSAGKVSRAGQRPGGRQSATQVAVTAAPQYRRGRDLDGPDADGPAPDVISDTAPAPEGDGGATATPPAAPASETPAVDGRPASELADAVERRPRRRRRRPRRPSVDETTGSTPDPIIE